MSVNVVYTTSAVATGGRDGEAATTDGSFRVKLARPKEMGGSGGGNNPEQLFAAGYSACFLSSIQFVAAQEKTQIPSDTRVRATVGLGPRSEGGFGLEVALEVELPGLPHEQAEALVEKAHQICPYSNATRNNIAVKLSVVPEAAHA
jgi:Ohr subfamily peroxiredoxin